ncbi:MAG: hypothetical protein FJW95_07850, partial [Actinobacteria bacterium]|nr:hypothetical protein [Actinomycetota bacterium]
LVHAAAAGSHGGDTTLMWLFAATAAAQLGSAGALLLWPGRIAAFAAAAVNGAAVLAWVGSRTVGLAGPLAGVEPVGTQDLIAAVLGAVATIAAVASLWSAREASPGRRRPASPAVVALTTSAVLLLAVPAMAAEHTHGDHDHDHAAAAHAHSDDAAHDHGDGAAHDHSDDEAHGGGAHGGDSADGVGAAADAGPIVSIDDPRLTKSQRREATALLTNSRVALGAFPDEAAVVAAGYRSIGDGRAVGRFEHFVHPGYMNDGRELDPGAIESIVLQKQADGSKRVMSAMYILERGKTMADVPDIAGSLTTWHDHQNLCWDESGTRLAGVLRDGVCVPGGTFRPTAPMLHVWVDDPPCGPFTGIEGHGGASCEHTHA